MNFTALLATLAIILSITSIALYADKKQEESTARQLIPNMETCTTVEAGYGWITMQCTWERPQ
jgi:hypothetical protein